MIENKTLVVIGGGAAGFFCAVNAARMHPRLNVLILEKTGKLLSKVKVSGGGRCNLTHASGSVSDMIKNYPRGNTFLKKAFHRFFTTDTVEWFESRGVKLKTEPDGRMFPVSDNSQTIIDCLLLEANKYNVQIKMHADIIDLNYSENRYVLTQRSGQVLAADYVCVAAGGYPSAQMFNWLSKTGHCFEAPVPSLFTFNIPQNPLKHLMGISIPQVSIKIQGSKLQAEGPILITHWGFSGPAVLKLSAWGARELAARSYKFSIQVNWLHHQNEQTVKQTILKIRTQSGSQKIINRNPFQLPQRFWSALLQQAGIQDDQRWAELEARQQNTLARLLTAQVFDITGKTTFKEEFVTCGGVSTQEVDPQTMQSRLLPGLYFAGEILDVDGITGGFNFQHAWTSGWIASELRH